MRKFFVTLAVLANFSLAELPICAEFQGEKNVQCVSGKNQAVIITTHADSTKTYEFFVGNKKAYILNYGVKNFAYISLRILRRYFSHV